MNFRSRKMVMPADLNGAGTLPSPGTLPWSGLHPDLAKFSARGGLTALLEEHDSESHRILKQGGYLLQGSGRNESNEARFKPVTQDGVGREPT